MGGFSGFFYNGGPWMVPIALVSVAVLTVAIERIYYLMFLYRASASTLMGSIARAVKSGDIEQAIRRCDTLPGAPVAQVLRSGLQVASLGEEEVQRALEEKTVEVIPNVQRRSNVLGGLASLATLLGLLGTIMGLITAFMVVADAPDDQKSILLTKAISIAMNTTAFGLMVAIPALFVHLFVSNTAKQITEDIEVSSIKLENLLFAKTK